MKLRKSTGRGWATVLIILAAIDFAHVTDARRIRLWFRTYDEHGNLSADHWQALADDNEAVDPVTVTLTYNATGIEYWLGEGGSIDLRTTFPGPDGRAGVRQLNRPTIGAVTIGGIRFNEITYGAAAEDTPAYGSDGRPPDYHDDPYYDPQLIPLAQAGFQFLEQSGSSFQKRQVQLFGDCFPKDTGSYEQSCSVGYWVQSIKNPDEPCWLCSACPIKGITCTKAPKTCTDISYGKDGQIGCNGPPSKFVCPGLDKPDGCGTYVSCQNGKVTKQCGSSVPDCDAGAAECLKVCTSCT